MTTPLGQSQATLLFSQGPCSRGNEIQCDCIVTAEHTTTTQKYEERLSKILIFTSFNPLEKFRSLNNLPTFYPPIPPPWNPFPNNITDRPLYSVVNTTPTPCD